MDLLHISLRRRDPDPYHRVIGDFNLIVHSFDKPRILELGSRNVTGITHRHNHPNCGEYVGFDIRPGGTPYHLSS
jgi:hypothetical protein